MAFNFNPFTEDLSQVSPAANQMFTSNDFGGFLEYLLKRGGAGVSPYNRQFLDQQGSMMGFLMPMLSAYKGTKASGLEGANMFGNMAEEYFSPFKTKGSMTGNALGALRGLAGKGSTGTPTQQTYLGGENVNNVLGQLIGILQSRMGNYMYENLFGSGAAEDLANRYAMSQPKPGEGQGQDIVQWLMAQGIL